MIFFYTVTSPEQIPLCDNLKKSLSRFDASLTILPIYEKNNFSKLKINNILLQNTYEDDDFIVICDGFDVVCAKHPESIQTYFDNHRGEVDILISSENMFGNNLICIKDYFDKYNDLEGTTGKYPNSGVIMGKANKIKKFYFDVTMNIESLKRYIPPERHETTGDQTFIINYLYFIDFVNYTPLKIKIDLKDELTFTNTIVERPFSIFDYVFIHTWGIYIKDPAYKYIKDQQYKKWTDINSSISERPEGVEISRVG